VSFSPRAKKTQAKTEPGKEGELFPADWQSSRWNWKWLKKSNSLLLMPRELRKLVDHDQREITISPVRCELLGLPRSTLYYKPIPVPESTLGSWQDRMRCIWRIQRSGSRRKVQYLPEKGSPISP